MRYRITAFAVLATMVACAQVVKWEHPTAPKERWGADQSTCKRFAAREASKEDAKQARLAGRDMQMETVSHDARMAAYETKKFETRTYERCMTRKGYTKIK